MNRIALPLTALGLLLLAVLFYVFVFQPTRDQVADLDEQVAAEQAQQAQLEQEIARLRDVRERAPEVEADLAAAEAIVPQDPALPALVRQLQTAADDAGMTLSSISTSRPTEIADAPEPGLSSMSVDGQLAGTYFQMVDFLRRIEDPSITPRGVTWSNVTVARPDADYPELQFSLSGSAYAVIETEPPPEAEPEPDADGAEGDDEADGEPAEDEAVDDESENES
jgi:Tfp pilus assembly protein PilO